MAEQIPQAHLKNNIDGVPPPEETHERGCFDFLKKKDEKDDAVMTDIDTAKEGKEEEKHALMDELRHTHSHSTSSSDEEVEEGGERKKKKKKKGLKEVIKDKIVGEEEGEDSGVPMEKCSEEGNAEAGQPEEKKGFLEKIKEKLPGQHKKGDEETQTPPAAEHSPVSESKEKKGILEKIKEKLPGNHKNNQNEVDK